MKRNTPEKLESEAVYRRLHAKKQRKRNSSGGYRGGGGGTSPHKVIVPSILDIYGPNNHTLTTEFLSQLRVYGSRGRVRICFSNTVRITAAAGILFVAELDRLVKKYGSDNFVIGRPTPQRRKFGQLDYTVEAVLNQIGVFKRLNQVQRDICPSANVECWQVQSSSVAEGKVAGEMLKTLSNRIQSNISQSLYRGAIEALSNCVEHAYVSIRDDGLSIVDNRWWMFTAIMENRLVVLVCDLGVGIPNTIESTQSKNLLETIFEKFGFTATSDSGWIKTATLVKETRTDESNRGKGGGDLRNLVKVDKNATLSIFSNKGYYKHTNSVNRSGKVVASPEILLDHKHSILGTIVEWSVEMV